MLGHFIGMAAQVATETLCRATIGNRRICAAAGIGVHEFMVEPLVNSLVIESLQYHKEEGLDYKNLIVSSVGAIVIGQATHHYIERSPLNLSHWQEIFVESCGSLVGSFMGGLVCDAFSAEG